MNTYEREEKLKLPEFTEYQRRVWRLLTYTTICRFYIDREADGRFIVKKIGSFRVFLYYLIWLNSLTKLGYILLTYNGWLLHVGFLDQMSMWVWFIVFSEMIQETMIWYGKSPLHEILIANWRVQEEIWRKLGSPKELQGRILRNCYFFSRIHTVIVVVGCIALMIQFFTAPKYASNTFAIVPWDNWPLRIIFAAHEFFFMWHAWINAASTIVLCEVFAVTYTQIIGGMSEVMQRLPQLYDFHQNVVIHQQRGNGIADIAEMSELNRTDRKRQFQNAVRRTKGQKFMPDRKLNPQTMVPGTEYNVILLVKDYKNVMIATTEFNKWVGFKVGGIVAALYCEFTSDIFMIFQLLKEPETDKLAVFFYCENATVGMFFMFLMIIMMSRVLPTSAEFLRWFQTYLQNDLPSKKYLLKYQRGLRKVAAKIGGHSTNPGSVPKAIHTLFYYYIAAAMWQRPLDRLT